MEPNTKKPRRTRARPPEEGDNAAPPATPDTFIAEPFTTDAELRTPSDVNPSEILEDTVVDEDAGETLDALSGISHTRNHTGEHTHTDDYLIGPAALPRERISPIHGGGGRGTEATLATIEAFNRTSTRYVIVPRIFDPAPGKGRDLTRRALARGVQMESYEAPIEDAIDRFNDPLDRSPYVIQIDSPRSVARALRRTSGTLRATLTYMLFQPEREPLSTMRTYLRPEQTTERELLARFLDRLADARLPGGSETIFGRTSGRANIAGERMHRAWISEHFTRNLPKATANLEPDASPFEYTRDGLNTSPMVILESPFARDPQVLAREVFTRPPFPIKRGADLVIAELTPDALRLHSARRRRFDGEITVHQGHRLDRVRLGSDLAPRVVATPVVTPVATRVVTVTPTPVPVAPPSSDSGSLDALAALFGVFLVIAAVSPVATTD